jgi:hypothetical protein
LFHKPSYMKSYNKFYYEKNKKQILVSKQIKRTNAYFDLVGHIKPIHDAIRRYASQWRIPIDSLKKFRRWAVMDSAYEELFKAWEEADYPKELTPVVMRRVMKHGFVTDNLYWSTKSKHPWWNGELDKLNILKKEMEKRQTKNNEANENEQEEMISRLKAKRKEK